MAENIVLEVCCGDIDSVYAAEAAGAQRVELCSGLAEGGMTPSFGFIAMAVAHSHVKVHVLIRQRPGDFVYNPAEIGCMAADVELAGRCGADGVVIGALTPDGDIDMDACRRMLQHRGSMSVTFSRAFDLCRNPEQALEQLIELGCDRVLTSGCAQTAIQGTEMLNKLNTQASGRIIVLAGCGVNKDNASEIVRASSVTELHASARETVQSKMRWRNNAVSMGKPGSDEYSRLTSTVDSISQIVKSLKS